MYWRPLLQQYMPRFPFYKQMDAMDCGPTCLRMIAGFHGKNYSLQTLRDKCFLTREGVSLLGVSDAAASIGFHSVGTRISFAQLSEQVPLPAIVHWKGDHFVVVYDVKKGKVYVADPAYGRLTYKTDEFIQGWCGQETSAKGVALLLEPTPDFFAAAGEKPERTSLRYLFQYVSGQRKFLWQLGIGLLLGSLFQLLFPFLTQAIVDVGI
ncbi:MAG: cysteine peptidase family C39 domain-containing protein, partial [Marinilabiliales bacterium]|nr:cysteine peptidase family C39 domain-containing protein [Marinilabiliales bacterium]